MDYANELVELKVTYMALLLIENVLKLIFFVVDTLFL